MCEPQTSCRLIFLQVFPVSHNWISPEFFAEPRWFNFSHHWTDVPFTPGSCDITIWCVCRFKEHISDQHGRTHELLKQAWNATFQLDIEEISSPKNEKILELRRDLGGFWTSCMEPIYIFFSCFLLFKTSYLSCQGECSNSDLLWSCKNALWRQTPPNFSIGLRLCRWSLEAQSVMYTIVAQLLKW